LITRLKDVDALCLEQLQIADYAMAVDEEFFESEWRRHSVLTLSRYHPHAAGRPCLCPTSRPKLRAHEGPAWLGPCT